MQLHSDRWLMLMGHWAKHPCTYMPFLRTESVPIHKIPLCPAATLLINLQVLTIWECTAKEIVSTYRGNLAFWCSDVYCWLSQSGPAVASVSGRHKLSKRRLEQWTLAWCFTFYEEVSASAMRGTLKNQFFTQNWVGLNVSPTLLFSRGHAL